MSLRFSPESFITLSTGLSVFLKRSEQSSSNLARVSVSSKSIPSIRPSMKILTCWTELRSRFAFSTSALSFWRARLSLLISTPCFFLKALTKWSVTR